MKLIHYKESHVDVSLIYSNGDFNIARGGDRSGALVKLDRDIGDSEAEDDHESQSGARPSGRRGNGKRGRSRRRKNRKKNQNQRGGGGGGGRRRTGRRGKNNARSQEYLDRR